RCRGDGFRSFRRQRRRSHQPPRGAACGERNRHERGDDPAAAIRPSLAFEPAWSKFRYCGDGFRSEAEGTHRTGDVLNLLLAEIIEGDRQFVADLVADGAGDAQPARFAQALQPRGDIDAVPENVAGLADNVADIDTDTEDEPLVFRHARVAQRDPLLDRDRTSDSLDRARKFDKNTVPGGLDDTAVASRDRRVYQLSPVSAQGTQGADLVGSHKPAIANDVCRHDGREPAFDTPLGGHGVAAAWQFDHHPSLDDIEGARITSSPMGLVNRRR